MNLQLFAVAVIASFAAVHAEIKTIGHDQVQPFIQPEPVSAAEKAAVKFKPHLKVTYGCTPYPAVDAEGAINGGLKWSGAADGGCSSPPLGAQIYARSDQYRDKWAIMYAWYFPKARQPDVYIDGHRHMWHWAVVWIEDPALEDATVLGISITIGVNYRFVPAYSPLGIHKETSPKSKYFDSSSVKLESYGDSWGTRAASLQLTTDKGGTHDLIQWDQLTDAARESLNMFDFDQTQEGTTSNIQMPLKDGAFIENLERAFPF